MQRLTTLLLIAASLLIHSSLGNLLTLYSKTYRRGDSRDITGSVPKLGEIGFFRQVASAEAVQGDWELYTEPFYNGRRYVIREGEVVGTIHQSASFFFQNTDTDEWISSVRPLCKYTEDPQLAELTVYDAEGRSRTFTLDQHDLSHVGWDNRITRVSSNAGTWEFYPHPNYAGNRQFVRAGHVRTGLGARASSLRPVCKGNLRNERCELKRIEIPETSFNNSNPKFVESRVIGFKTAASCTVYDRRTVTLRAEDMSDFDEVLRIGTHGPSVEDAVNWYISENIEVVAPFRITDSYEPVQAKVVEGKNQYDHLYLSVRSKNFFSHTNAVVNSINFDPPGAAMIMATVDKYLYAETEVDVLLHLDCSGKPRVISSRMFVATTTYPVAHVLGLHGKTGQKVCFHQDPMVECMDRLQTTYERFEGNVGRVQQEYNRCIELGGGVYEVLQSDTYQWIY